MAESEQFMDNNSLDKHTGALFTILKCLENDDVDKVIDNVVERLSTDLEKTEACSAHALDALYNILKLKVTRRKDQVEKKDFGKTVQQFFALLNAPSFQNNPQAQHLCDILSFLLSLLSEEHLSEASQSIFSNCERQLQCFISGNLSRTRSLFTVHINLRIVDAVLTTLIYTNGICSKPFPALEALSNVLLELMLCEEEQITAYISLNIIPKLLKFTGTNHLLQKIWQYLVKMHVSTNRDDASLSAHPQVFHILCALAEYFIPTKEFGNHPVDLTMESDFWKILQEGLTHWDPIIRKQGLYLMKRAVDSMYQRNLSVGLFTTQSLFWWDSKTSKHLIKIWEEFFLIIETLEEKQTHIIKPVLPLIDRIVECCSVPFACEYVVDKSWLFVIFQRVISHDSAVIVKWGISYLVNTNRKLHISHSEYFISKFTVPLLNAVNNSALYIKNAECLSLEIREELCELFKSVAVGNPKISTVFFCELLTKLQNISWSPVPLFNVIYALANISLVPAWDTQALIQLKAFSLNALRTQHTFIRGAIQCLLLKCITKFSNGNAINFETVVDLLGIFRDTESLKRGTSAWDNISQWLSMWVSKETATDFISKFLVNLKEPSATKKEDGLQVNKRAVARIIILLCDSDVIYISTGSPIHKSLLDLGDCLYGCRARSYINETAQQESLEMLICLLKEAQSISGHTVQEDKTRNGILNLINSMVEGIFVYIWKRMNVSKSIQEYYVIEMCMDALDTLCTEPTLLSVIASKICELQNKALLVANSEIISFPAIRKYFSIKILAWISCCIRKYRQIVDTWVWMTQTTFVEYIIKNGRLNHILVKEQEMETSARDVQTLWGRIVSGYLESLWCIFADYLYTDTDAERNIFSFTSTSSITREALEALEVGGRTVLIPVMTVLKKLLSHNIDVDEINATSTLISLCWSSTFELRKTALFWTCMKLFVEMMFQCSLTTSSVFRETLVKYAGEMINKGKTIPGLSNLLIKQLQDVALSSPEILEDYCEVIVDALTFGSVLRRDQRIHSDVCAFIESLGEDCAVNVLCSNDCSADNEVRARAVQLLLSLCTSSNHQHLVEFITTILIQKEETECGGKNRYFGDSQLHHLKHRVMQALLLLEPALTLEHKNLLLKWLKDCLVAEGNQPSVRYQKEWLIVRILHHNTHLRQSIWDFFQEASKKRAGSLCSFISITYQLACIIDDSKEQEEFLERGMREIAPWCMAQQFTIRLYAQTIIQKLFLLCEEQNFTSTAGKYAMLKLCIQSSVQQGSAVKNSLKLQEDFYFNGFHPIRHYSLETIFNELPRLANVAQEECISVSLLKSSGVTDSAYITLENSDLILKKYNVAAWVLRTAGATVEERDEATYNETEISSNVQKKLIPWKSMFPDVGLLLSSSIGLWERKQRAATEGIIVIASLIDKAPNLGGLCRTCEVFGVTEYVIGNLRYTEDKQFQLLSVTAEQWVTITEVKVHMLSKYVEEKKRMGYTLVGAEQTANSKLLNEVKFPKKTMLLLGNEREGIPANLLPLLDVCVEIPQQGVVRSLNVHVTGALFLWEYCRQHMLN